MMNFEKQQAQDFDQILWDVDLFMLEHWGLTKHTLRQPIETTN